MHALQESYRGFGVVFRLCGDRLVSVAAVGASLALSAWLAIRLAEYLAG